MKQIYIFSQPQIERKSDFILMVYGISVLNAPLSFICLLLNVPVFSSA